MILFFFNSHKWNITLTNILLISRLPDTVRIFNWFVLYEWIFSKILTLLRLFGTSNNVSQNIKLLDSLGGFYALLKIKCLILLVILFPKCLLVISLRKIGKCESKIVVACYCWVKNSYIYSTVYLIRFWSGWGGYKRHLIKTDDCVVYCMTRKSLSDITNDVSLGFYDSICIRLGDIGCIIMPFILNGSYLALNNRTFLSRMFAWNRERSGKWWRRYTRQYPGPSVFLLK